MSAQYRILFSEAYASEKDNRLKHRPKFVTFLIGTLGLLLLAIAFCVLILLFFWGAPGGFLGMAVSLIILLLVILLAPRFLKWLRKFFLGRLPEYNTEMVIDLSLEKYIRTMTTNRVELEWVVFKKARRLPDGYMLYGRVGADWLPDKALIEGTLEEVNVILREKVPGYVGT